MADDWDFLQYNRVMWRGFDYEGEPTQDEDNIQWRKTMLSSPHIIPELIIAIVASNGNYVSHCGLWYTFGDNYAYVEPVATDSEYRKMGLGKAAVYESILRTKQGEAINRSGIIEVEVKIEDKEPVEIKISGSTVIAFQTKITI